MIFKIKKFSLIKKEKKLKRNFFSLKFFSLNQVIFFPVFINFFDELPRKHNQSSYKSNPICDNAHVET